MEVLIIILTGKYLQISTLNFKKEIFMELKVKMAVEKVPLRTFLLDY
jgi:hypothetical protein